MFGHWFVYRFIRVFSTHMPSPPSPFKGRKRTLLGAHGDSLAFHAYYDTGHPFIGSSPRTSDILTCYLEFASGKVCRDRNSNTRPSAYETTLYQLCHRSGFRQWEVYHDMVDCTKMKYTKNRERTIPYLLLNPKFLLLLRVIHNSYQIFSVCKIYLKCRRFLKKL